MALLATLAIPVQMAAQASQDRHHQPHHYQLVDMGTFGGPLSYLADTGIPRNGTDVNNHGVLTGFADTSTPDPFAPNWCFNQDCFVDHAFQWQNGAVTDLGVLPNGWSSASVGISANGLIAGFAQNGEIESSGFPELRAVLWQNGGITDLGTLPEGGYESVANAVNSRGQVVGAALNAIPDPNSIATSTLNFVFASTQTRAFLWQEGVMQDLGTLGGPDAVAARINEHGQVVGWSYTSSAPSTLCPLPLVTGSFIWDKKNEMRDLGNFGGTCTLALDLNNRGQVVGLSDLPGDAFNHAFLWEHGSIHDLGGSFGGNNTQANAINDHGQVVGFAFLAGDTLYHAALWKHVGQIADLGTVAGDLCSFAAEINAQGQVVGGSNPDCGNETLGRAFLWEDGAIFDLNALIPPGSTLYLDNPNTINDGGEIAGTGVDVNGNQHAFLLIPCDENHSGVEGCDYSLVDADATSQSLAPRYVPSGTLRRSQSGRTNRYLLPGLLPANR